MYKPDPQELSAMRDIDICSTDPGGAAKLEAISIDPSLPPRERMLDFLRQAGNPYLFRYGDMLVKISFAENGPTLEERVSECAAML